MSFPLRRALRRLLNLPAPPPDEAAAPPLDVPAPPHPDRLAEALRVKLFELGFHCRARAELAEMAGRGKTPKIRCAAARHLVLWHANQDTEADAIEALRWVALMAEEEQKEGRMLAAHILAAECEARIGRHEGAKARISNLLLRLPDNLDLLLASSILEGAQPGEVERLPERRLRWLNQALALAGHSPVELGAGDASPYDRLTSANPTPAGQGTEDGRPLVTVIMPCFNSAATIRTALRSVCAQTWQPLQILVVDDCSTDDSPAVVASLAANDPRIVLLHTQRNAGPYVARNIALQHAAGEFITCHDADDWSHPSKIEVQVKHLVENPGAIANTSQQARAFPDLQIHRRGNNGYYISPNYSSLLFRSQPARSRLGNWDPVRFGADGEWIRRLEVAFGAEAIVHLPTGPLSLQRQSGSSLTAHPTLGFHGYPTGARRHYQHVAQKYARSALPPPLFFPYPMVQRPFAVPATMLQPPAIRDSPPFSDLVVAADLRPCSPAITVVGRLIKLRREARRGTILLHALRYGADPFTILHPVMLSALEAPDVRLLMPGDQLHCDLLAVLDPAAFVEPQAHMPDLKASRIDYWLFEPPHSALRPTDLVRCARHLAGFCQASARWLTPDHTLTQAWSDACRESDAAMPISTRETPTTSPAPPPPQCPEESVSLASQSALAI